MKKKGEGQTDGQSLSIRYNGTYAGRMGDALALGGEEGRDKLRKAAVRGKYPLTRGCPNGATRRERSRHHAEREANGGN